MDEFARIAHYFAPLAGPESLDLKDDAAKLVTPAGSDIIMTKDMLVEGVHVPQGCAPEVFARRALRSNVSDLAAMAATPLGYLLGLALPETCSEDWIDRFAKALGQDQAHLKLTLWGGDSVKTSGPILVSMTAIGAVLEGHVLRRSTAKPGDDVYVSGVIGRAAAGLKMAMGALNPGRDDWRRAYEAPEPRVRLGELLYGVASSCADVSDGLVADLGHIAKASRCKAVLQLADVPIDEDVPLSAEEAATAGDDYELVFTASKHQRGNIFTISQSLGLRLTRIGSIAALQLDDKSGAVEVYDLDGRALTITQPGWRHTD